MTVRISAVLDPLEAMGAVRAIQIAVPERFGVISRQGIRRNINGVISNGVVPKNQICKLVAKPAPEIFRIQGTCRDASLRKA